MTQVGGFSRHLIWQQTAHNPEVAGSNPAAMNPRLRVEASLTLTGRAQKRGVLDLEAP
jgi:hypothetical protein